MRLKTDLTVSFDDMTLHSTRRYTPQTNIPAGERWEMMLGMRRNLCHCMCLSLMHEVEPKLHICVPWVRSFVHEAMYTKPTSGKGRQRKCTVNTFAH